MTRFRREIMLLHESCPTLIWAGQRQDTAKIQGSRGTLESAYGKIRFLVDRLEPVPNVPSFESERDGRSASVVSDMSSL